MHIVNKTTGKVELVMFPLVCLSVIVDMDKNRWLCFSQHTSLPEVPNWSLFHTALFFICFFFQSHTYIPFSTSLLMSLRIKHSVLFIIFIWFFFPLSLSICPYFICLTYSSCPCKHQSLLDSALLVYLLCNKPPC